MNNFKFETKSLFNRVVVSFIIFYLLGGVLIMQYGISLYKDQLKNCDDFLILEQRKAEKSVLFIKKRIQGRILFKFMAKPSPLWSLFHCSTPIDDLICTVDNSGVLMNVSSSIGTNTFDKQRMLNLDLAIYTLISLSIFVMILGLYSPRGRNRVKFLLNFSSRAGVFWSFFLSRWVYLAGTMLALFGLVFLFFGFNRISLDQNAVYEIINYFSFTTGLMTLFLFLGSLSGFVKRDFLKYLFIFLIWPGLIFIIPGAITKFTPNTFGPDTTSIHRLEMQKFVTLTEFEDMISTNIKKFSTMTEKKEFMEKVYSQYVNEELKKMKDLDNELIENTAAKVKRIHFLDSSVPTAFYTGLCRELSSMGFGAFLDFYRTRSEIQKVVVESFLLNTKLPDLEFLYQTKSKRPGYFGLSLALLAVYICVVVFVLFLKFNRFLFPRINKDFSDIKIKGEKGKYLFFNIRAKAGLFCDKLFNVIFNGENFAGEFSINGEPVTGKKVFYLPGLGDIKTSALCLLSGGHAEKKVFSELSYKELKEVFPQIKNSDVLILDNVNLAAEIEPDEDIFILELSPFLATRKYDLLYLIYPDETGAGFKIKLRRHNQ